MKFLECFQGDFNEDAAEWLKSFEQNTFEFSEKSKAETFPLYLTGVAKIWYDKLSDTKKKSWVHLRNNFRARFHALAWFAMLRLESTRLLYYKDPEDYIEQIMKHANATLLSDEDTIFYMINGLPHPIKNYIEFVQVQSPTLMNNVKQCCANICFITRIFNYTKPVGLTYPDHQYIDALKTFQILCEKLENLDFYTTVRS